ncbi:C1 family peptidase [Spirosoma gilvum]
MKAFTLSILLLSCTLTLAQPKPKLQVQTPQLHVIFAMEPKGVEYARLNTENDAVMTHFVETIEQGLGYSKQIHRLDEDHFTARALQDTIKALKTTPNDIIIIYYSGYGIAPSDTTEKFANWRLDKEKELFSLANLLPTTKKETGVPVSEVENWLRAKNVHLGLLIADCSNEPIEHMGTGASLEGTVDLTPQIMNKLFNETKGIVRLGSSASSLPSYFKKNDSGTLFTRCLDYGLTYLLDCTDPSRLPNLSFEDLLLWTNATMNGQQLANSNYNQRAVLEVRTWEGNLIRPKRTPVDSIAIYARWQGFVASDWAYERLAQKKLDKSLNYLPKKIDLSMFAPPVISQGDKGNCVAISIGYYMRSIMQAIQLNLTKKEDKIKHSASPFALYSSLKSPADENCTFGINPEQALEYLKTTGIPGFSSYPDPNFCQIGQFKGPPSSRIYDYVKLFSITDSKENKVLAVKQTLADKSPVVVGVMINSSLQNLAFTQTLVPRIKSSLYELKAFVTKVETDKSRSGMNLSFDPYKAKALSFGHALCVVGYDDNALGIGKGAFKLINSWGSGWGNDGYFWMSYDVFGKFAKYGYQAYVNESGSAIRADIDLTMLKGSLGKQPLFTLVPSDTSWASYVLTQDQQTGTPFRFKIDTKKKTYVYLITGSSTDSTARLQSLRVGIDDCIDPNSRDYNLSKTPLKIAGRRGTEYMLFLFSDEEIANIKERVEMMNVGYYESPFPDRVRHALSGSLISNRQIQYKPKKMGFFLPQTSQYVRRGNIAPLLVTINHVP